MSLLITSSKQKEFDGVATHSIGIERPYSYINTMRSPLIIDADSEIAVVSVKCERNGKLEVDSRGFRVGLYWGNELTAGNTLTSARSTNRVVYASVRGGTYTPSELAEELRIALNTVAVNTFSNMNSVVVTTQQDTNGDFSGFEFTFSQNASSTDVKASLTTIATVNNNNKNPPGRLAESYGIGPENTTDAFTYTQGTQTLTAGAGFNTATFTSHPLSSTSGVCEVNFKSCTKDFKIGLVRNFSSDRPCPENFNDDTGLVDETFNHYDEFYDFAFAVERTNAKAGTTANFFCQSYMDFNLSYGMGKIASASQQNTIPNASFGDSNGSFGMIRFTRFGEELKVELCHNDGGGGDTTIFDSSDAALKPIGLFNDLLYLKIELGDSGGSCQILQFDSDQTTVRTSTDERNYGYGDTAEAIVQMEVQNALIESLPGVAATGTIVDPEDGDTTFEAAPVYSKLNASGGQDRNWVMLLAPSNGYETGDFIRNDTSTELGFIDPIVRESVNVTPISTTNDVVFDSDTVPTLLQLKNMFVRFNGLQQQSFNANQGSISKIIYACPRFDSAGTRTGELYYEPHERVYVNCNNSDKVILSDISVDLVDVNEQYCEDLVGQTQINFHIRKKK